MNQTSKLKILFSLQFTVKSLNMFLGKLKAAAGAEGISSDSQLITASR